MIVRVACEDAVRMNGAFAQKGLRDLEGLQKCAGAASHLSWVRFFGSRAVAGNVFGGFRRGFLDRRRDRFVTRCASRWLQWWRRWGRWQTTQRRCFRLYLVCVYTLLEDTVHSLKHVHKLSSMSII